MVEAMSISPSFRCDGAHMVHEMSSALRRHQCRPDHDGTQYDTLINGLGTGQPAAGADEKSTQEYIEQYSTR